MNHQPVMLNEVLSQLAIKPTGYYIDGTFGRGGHSAAIVAQLAATARFIAFDRDLEAIQSPVAQQLAADSRVTLIHSPFSQLRQHIDALDLCGQIDGILLDLGVSSPQLDNPERGFSFQRNGPLDMRMDNATGLSAAQWLAQVDEVELARVLFEYGEERFSRRVARAIVSQRQQQAISTTGQLAQLVADNIPVREKHKHPATRTFQAIRIAVNGELDELQTVLQQALTVLKPQGRLVVISFHSLEDRIVKRFFRDHAGIKYPAGKLPFKESDITHGVLKKASKAIKASEEELATNVRARSAVLRVTERV